MQKYALLPFNSYKDQQNVCEESSEPSPMIESIPGPFQDQKKAQDWGRQKVMAPTQTEKETSSSDNICEDEEEKVSGAESETSSQALSRVPENEPGEWKRGRPAKCEGDSNGLARKVWRRF